MTREQWWAFCEKNVLKLDCMPTYEEFCNNEFLWSFEPLMTKFKYKISVEGKVLYVDLTRMKDNKTKRYTFIATDLPYPLATRPYRQFMSSLTDDQCEALLKG
jgi:hypothetical protein